MTVKTIYTQLKDKLGGFQLLITVFMICALIYSSVTTWWIPPIKKINITENNQTFEIDGVYSYVHKDYIKKTKDFESMNSQIPKGSFEFQEAFLYIFLIIVLSMLNLRKGKETNPADEKEVREKAKTYLDKKMAEGKIKEYKMPVPCYLREKQVHDGEKVADTWFIPAELTTDEGEIEYHMIGFNPFTVKLKMDIKTKKEFRGEDICPNCGQFYSMKIITPEGYREWYDTFEAPRKR